MGVTKAGREEAREHHISLKLGEKLASDHKAKFGPNYYPALEKLEKKFLARKNRKRKRT
jgi:hypothetical protein